MNQLLSLLNQYGGYFFILLFVLDVAVFIWVLILRKNYKKIFRGGGEDLEQAFLDLRNHQGFAVAAFEKINTQTKALEEALPKGIRRVGLVRYNPFSDAGGDQSFALALLNDHNDGVVLTSLYGREINRVYAKPIQSGQSTYQLTVEERKAIDNAK